MIGLTSTTNDFFTINWKLGPSMARSTTFHVFKKKILRPQKLLGPKISSFKDTRSKLHLKYLGVQHCPNDFSNNGKFDLYYMKYPTKCYFCFKNNLYRQFMIYHTPGYKKIHRSSFNKYGLEGGSK